MPLLSVACLATVAILAIILVAAYMIDAERFEVTSHIWKIVSLSIKIEAPRKRVRK